MCGIKRNKCLIFDLLTEYFLSAIDVYYIASTGRNDDASLSCLSACHPISAGLQAGPFAIVDFAAVIADGISPGLVAAVASERA